MAAPGAYSAAQRADLDHVCMGEGDRTCPEGMLPAGHTPACTPHYGSSQAITTLFFLSSLVCGPSLYDSVSSMRSEASSVLFQKLTQGST